MIQSNIKAKRKVIRKGNSIALIFEFPSEYEAMLSFDIFCQPQISFTYEGPVEIEEVEETAS